MSTYATGRKRHVKVSTEEVIAYVCTSGAAMTVAEVAEGLGISTGTARRHLDGGVYRGELAFDDHDPEGYPANHLDWRYCEAA